MKVSQIRVLLAFVLSTALLAAVSSGGADARVGPFFAGLFGYSLLMLLVERLTQ